MAQKKEGSHWTSEQDGLIAEEGGLWGLASGCELGLQAQIR